MKKIVLKNANYIGWIVIVLAFVFIYFSYFFIYIPKKEVQLQQKGFRILKEYGSNMLDKHSYFESHFKNYGIFYSIRHLEEDNKIKKRASRNLSRSTDIDNVIKGLQKFVTTANQRVHSSYIYNDNNNQLFLCFYRANTPELISELMDFYEKAQDTLPINTVLARDYSHHVPINDFMENLKFDRLFENIILFDEDVVSFNSNPGNLADITNPKALSDSATKYQGGIYKRLNIRGEDKHAMVLPIDFVGKRFYIAGFISDTDFKNKTRTINKQLLIFIAGILLLVFAGMPILKIILSDNNERLITSDASGSGISLLFGIGLFILLIIAFSKKQFIDKSSQQKRLTTISDTLYSNVTKDFNTILSLGEAIIRDGTSHSIPLADKIKRVFKSNATFFQDSNLTYHFPLNEVFLIDEKGNFSKGYTRTPFSDIVEVNLSQRQYFRNIKDIDQSWPTSNGTNIYIESIKSFNTGNVETAISFSTENFSNQPVLAITSVIPSLYKQIIPKDIEFVIINKKGKVLYHSIQEKNLHENFVMECESNLQLVNAINSLKTESIQINYNEKQWLARIQPIKDTPLYHITLLNLNQADNLNARIFLYTFYFLVTTLAIIIIGLLIIRWITLARTAKDKNHWFLSWIVLQPCKYKYYNTISLILLSIIVMQIIGFVVVKHPISLLFYQLIFIVYTLFVSMSFLNRTQDNLNKSFFIEFFTELGILLAWLTITVIYLWNFDPDYLQLTSISILIIITFYVIFKLKRSHNPENNTANNLDSSKVEIVKRSYILFLFLWLASISAIPVVVYYFSIKKEENKTWNQQLALDIAQKNAELDSVFRYTDNNWMSRIQGNGIDSLSIDHIKTYKEFDSSLSPNFQESFSHEIYIRLPDPITQWYNQPKLKSDANFVSQYIHNDTLYFKKGLDKGAVQVIQPNIERRLSASLYTMLIIAISIIVAICAIFLIKYLAKVLLNLNQEKPIIPKESWEDIIQNPEQKKILLNSFDGACFLKKSLKNFDRPNNRNRKIEPITAIQILSPDFKINSLPKSTSSVLWISEFNQLIYDFDKHEKLLSALNEINQNIKARIVVDLGFNFKIINEFYDDLINSGKLSDEQQAKVFLLETKWKNIFDNYLIYNGYINQSLIRVNENIRIEDDYGSECKIADQQIRFKNIWSTLSSNEKMLLYDLAVDGLVNRKNETMIQKLVDKRLIIFDPEPSLFSESFRIFVLHNLKPTEVKSIERKLGIKGSWHNAKYIILLTIIPLAALVIISQGISIEKAFTILGGGLAVFTGILRLFDSGLFKQN